MKVIAKVAIIVGAAAAIIASAGALAPAFAAAFTTATGLSMAAVAAIGTIASIVGTLAASKPKLSAAGSSGSVGGSLTDFKLDPRAGVPIMFGRTFHAGNIVHRDTWGSDNQYQGFAVVYSGCGPIDAIEGFQVDRQLITFAGSAASDPIYGSGTGAPWMWLTTQLGLTPEPAALVSPVDGFPGWTAAHKLSGLAAGIWVLKFDKENGKKYAGGIPRSGIVGRGVRCWDPRYDSTWPGGSGPQRLADPATWGFTENPYIQGHQFALGWFQGPATRLAGGVGSPLEAIDTPAWIEAANIADANGWKSGGIRYSHDSKWDTLKLLCQAGMGEPLWLGARLSVLVSAPKVSVATITSKDLRGPVKITGTQTRRGGRVNTLIPNYVSEDHGWEPVPAHAVSVGTYVVEDGGTRTQEVLFPMIQDVDQVAVAAAYSIVNGREFGPIAIPLDPRWSGLRPGMAVDLDIPEAGLVDQQAVVIARTLDGNSVSFDLRSETPEKHPFALGTTTVAPPTPSLAAPDWLALLRQYESSDQAAAMIRLSSPRFDLSDAHPVFAVDPGDGTSQITVRAHFRDYPDGSVAIAEQILAGRPLKTAEQPVLHIYYDDASRAASPPVMQTDPSMAVAANSAAHPYRHYVSTVTLAEAGQTTPSESFEPTYGGSNGCPVEGARIQIAEDGQTKRAADLVPGVDRVWTMHEHTGEWGSFLVTAVNVFDCPDVRMVLGLKASAGHRLWAGGDHWVAMRDIAGAVEVAPERCVQITVEDAHTFVAEGLLSHNMKPLPGQGL